MNFTEDVLQELDYYRIRESIASLCVTEEAAAELNKRLPSSQKDEINYFKILGRECFTYLNSNNEKALYDFPPVREYFLPLGIEGTFLTQDKLFALGLFTRAVLIFISHIVSASESLNIEHLKKEALEIPDIKPVNEKIFSILTKEGELKDLPELREIKNEIFKTKKEIENAIKKYTTNSSYTDALQSTVPAFRADRELLAVRADHSSFIKGIVHEVSSSGLTLYIEPEEIIRLNNDLIQKEAKLESELKKIFTELTEDLGKYKENLLEAHKKILLLDQCFAAASWQKKVNGIFAEDCDTKEEPPLLLQARHPLLEEKAVPIDIRFMHGKNVLIITGPNTGGKTVTLKTIALFTLLNQAGFPVPASDGTRLPIFSSVFADIGDEQSIDQSLSTFSSHMKKTANMILNADSESLILLDELGSGTDPQEGSAIAMATLDTLIEKHSFVIVTTHHGVLKNYGYTNKNCINASVEFDNEKLSPTYKLLMGVPGESHALEIAEHSGLPHDVIKKARSYITNQQADVSSLIKGLTQKHEELDETLKEQKEKQEKLEQKELRLKERELKLQEEQIALKEKQSSKENEFLRETRSLLENLVRELREGEITREKTLKVRSFINELTENVSLHEEKLEEEKSILDREKEIFLANGMRILSAKERKASNKKKNKARLSNKEAFLKASITEASLEKKKNDSNKKQTIILFSPGQEVLAGREKRKGILIQKTKKSSWVVQFGALKMTVPETQLMPVNTTQNKSTSSVEHLGENGISFTTDEKPKFELKLLGMRYEEAMKAIEKQLDLCVIHNFKDFSIIHGKGNGILQQAVYDYLSHYPGVKEFHFASPEDGGSGKTYVSLV